MTSDVTSLKHSDLRGSCSGAEDPRLVFMRHGLPVAAHLRGRGLTGNNSHEILNVGNDSAASSMLSYLVSSTTRKRKL